MYSAWEKSDEAEKYDKLFYKTTTEQERKSILETVQHSRWKEWRQNQKTEKAMKPLLRKIFFWDALAQGAIDS